MTDNNRPEVLLSAADHWEDIKIRWQIHQYEMNHLMKDLSLVLNALTDRCLLYTSPSPRDVEESRMPSSA